MGTLHENTHPLHGITVVVELTSGETWVGRCQDWNPQWFVLRDADSVAAGDPKREDWLERARRFGVWPREAWVRLRSEQIRAVRRLGEVGA